nr:MAG TPA: hypothetical protein [Caudoviricetes sp.]
MTEPHGSCNICANDRSVEQAPRWLPPGAFAYPPDRRAPRG